MFGPLSDHHIGVRHLPSLQEWSKCTPVVSKGWFEGLETSLPVFGQKLDVLNTSLALRAPSRWDQSVSLVVFVGLGALTHGIVYLVFFCICGSTRNSTPVDAKALSIILCVAHSYKKGRGRKSWTQKSVAEKMLSHVPAPKTNFRKGNSTEQSLCVE